MKAGLLALVVILAAMPASAHRLDEYLQGSIVSIERDRVQVQMTLTPGVAIFPVLIPYIDTDKSGEISLGEQRAYAERVLHDISIQVDGRQLIARLDSMKFPTIDEMKEGRGEIRLDFTTDLPRGGRARKFTLENHHLNQISAYQVNALVPADRALQIASQDRNYSQSVYAVTYADEKASATPDLSQLRWLGLILLLGIRPLFVFVRRRWYGARFLLQV